MQLICIGSTLLLVVAATGPVHVPRGRQPGSHYLAAHEMDIIRVCVPGADELLCESAECVPITALCDGKQQCLNGGDESYCTACERGYFKCANGRCVHSNEVLVLRCPPPTPCKARTTRAQTCNGRDDCYDGKGSDESRTTCPTMPQHCRRTEIKCPNTNICVPLHYLCNDRNDCGDGADEQTSFCMATACPPQHYRCRKTGRQV